MATILVDAHVEPTVHRRAHLVTDNKPLVIADIHYLPFKDKSMDFVYCSHILEHVDDPEKSCREVCRVGRRGYIETANFMKDVLFSWAEGMHKWYTVAINDELHFFDIHSLLNLFFDFCCISIIYIEFFSTWILS